MHRIANRETINKSRKSTHFLCRINDFNLLQINGILTTRIIRIENNINKTNNNNRMLIKINHKNDFNNFLLLLTPKRIVLKKDKKF